VAGIHCDGGQLLSKTIEQYVSDANGSGKRSTMNTTRCKFRCDELKVTASNGYVTLNAVHDSTVNKEDHAFNTATPGGKLEMLLYPDSKADFFTPGKYYYLDIQEVQEDVKP